MTTIKEHRILRHPILGIDFQIIGARRLDSGDAFVCKEVENSSERVFLIDYFTSTPRDDRNALFSALFEGEERINALARAAFDLENLICPRCSTELEFAGGGCYTHYVGDPEEVTGFVEGFDGEGDEQEEPRFLESGDTISCSECGLIFEIVQLNPVVLSIYGNENIESDVPDEYVEDDDDKN